MRRKMSINYCSKLFMVLTLSIGMMASCGDNNSKSTTDTTIKNDGDSSKPSDLEPANAKPEWAKDMTDPQAVVIEKLMSFKAPPLTSLPPEKARLQPSPADAAMAVMQDYKIPMPANNVDTTGKDIPVAGGQIHLRIYTPKTGKASYPVILYIHGGGWVIADVNTYNASAQGLANQAEAVVVSVNYRQAPEHKFPTAHNDCYAAYEWTMKNASSIKGDSSKIAVVGESAGGNLAASVSMMAREKGVKLPVHQVLVYPIAAYDFQTESYKESDSTKPLNAGLMKWFFDKYLKSAADAKSPMISLVSANLQGLPATTIIAAQYDPLRTEGEMLSDNLKKAGVSTTYKLYKGVNHEFFGMAAIIPEAKDAQALAVSELKKSWGQ